MESLTARTARMIQSQIDEAGLGAGDRLGTLAELCDQFGVSRTVIREAIAALAADGILESRHGVGVFVAEDMAETSRRRDSAVLQTMSQFSGSFMDMLELRMAFEVHAAGLAAQRKSLAQEGAIWSAARDFEAAVAADRALDEKDFAFHQAIIQATNNTAFLEFFSLMGARILPTATLSRQEHPTLVTDAYIEHTVQEHRAICHEISGGNAESAREAMRAHLSRVHNRYRGLLFQGM
ncbi:FCD domain-containing protein [Paracoccus aestuariivivens]|uniref:FCD domain-containing protein n=1 Tax=Paracoccus aestuariivivens TaxID=1820333 RepID=A0A6L6JCN6_9RHOB|nr:FCD domain-containing protein [Paracoccus aestuariivivens]